MNGTRIPTTPLRGRFNPLGLLALGMLLLAAAALSTPAMAHGRGRGHGHAKQVYKHKTVHRHVTVAPAYGHPYAHFAVPRTIVRTRFHAYHPYLHGSVFYGPHRHAHAVYHFPVQAYGGVIVRPHYYCGAELHHVGHYPAAHASGFLSVGSPRFSLELGF